MPTRDQLVDAVTSGGLFFARLDNGTYIARYTRHGPVEQVTDRGLKPLPWQGSDLCWHIRAEENDDQTD